MQAVLISINPNWCEFIASGKMTVDLRKTKPKLEVPFKCYIYMTAGYAVYPVTINGAPYTCINVGGKCVIGEFVCDKIYDITPHFDTPTFPNQYICGWEYGKEFDCLSFEELTSYLNGKNGYGWHISDLVIYDKPRELGEFYVEGDCDCTKCKECYWFDRGNGFNVEDDCNLAYKGVSEHKSFKPITRPPQSWCYVEDRMELSREQIIKTLEENK